MHGMNKVKFVIYAISYKYLWIQFITLKNTRVSITKIVTLILHSEITAVYMQKDIKHKYTTKPIFWPLKLAVHNVRSAS
jgi:hypothetical protein